MKTMIEEGKERIIMEWKPKEKHLCELEGPYECEDCGGHVMLDATYLDQVEKFAYCPYCTMKGVVKEEKTRDIEMYIGYQNKTWETRFVSIPLSIPEDKIEKTATTIAMSLFYNSPDTFD